MSRTRMCNISGFRHGRDLSSGFLKYNTVHDGSRITVPPPRPPAEKLLRPTSVSVTDRTIFLLRCAFFPVLLYDQPYSTLTRKAVCPSETLVTSCARLQNQNTSQKSLVKVLLFPSVGLKTNQKQN